MVKRILIAAGGTGGHIIPAMALARELRERGHEVMMVGNTDGMEVGMYERAGLPYRLYRSQKLYRRMTLANARFPFRLIESIAASVRFINEFKPHAYIGTGSFVAGPVGLAAILRRVPVFLHESNSYPGMANRWLARRARRVYVGYQNTCKFLPGCKCVYTGNPLLPPPPGDTSPLEVLREGSSALFVIGGSQGSQAINRALEPIAANLAGEGVDILWQTGVKNLDQYREKFANVAGVHTYGFIDDMPRFYHSASFALSRAGALTLAELETHRVPALLAPLPSSGANRQYYNALELTSQGQAMMLEQKDLDPGRLYEMLLRLRNAAPAMKTRFKESKHLDAARVIVDDLLANIGGK